MQRPCGLEAGISDSSLHAQRSRLQFGCRLQAEDVRCAGKNQFDRIEDAGDIACFLEIKTIGDSRRQRIAIRSYSHQQFVFTFPQCNPGIEVARRETWQMVSERLSVENNPRAKHGFAYFQRRYIRADGADLESTSIPKRITPGVFLG